MTMHWRTRGLMLVGATAVAVACGDDNGGSGAGASMGATDAQSATDGTQGSGGESGSNAETDDADPMAEGSGEVSSTGSGSETGANATDPGDPSEPEEPWGHECSPRVPEVEIPPCEAQLGTEVEPNDTAEQATPYCLGQPMDAQILTVADEDIFEFTVPAAPYTGYVVATLDHIDPTAVLQLEIRAASDYGYIESDANLTQGANRIVWFAAEPEQTFRAIVSEYLAAEIGSYTFSAQWYPRFDCYEPNQSRDEARAIPLGEPVQAYLAGGYTDSDTPPTNRYSDWYRVQLEQGPVEIHVGSVPVDTRVTVELHDEDGNNISSDSSQGDGGSAIVEESLEAGNYFILVEPWLTPSAPDGRGTDVPAYFTDTYELTVSQ